MIGMRWIEGDSAKEWQMGMQEPATPVAEGIVGFHHDIMVVLVLIVGFVSWMLGRALYHFRENKVSDGVVHGTAIEIIWTIVPGVVLMLIGIPSFALLYAVEEIVDPELTLKAVGHQWYWTYEYGDNIVGGESGQLEFEAYMVAEEDLQKGDYRLLEVDNRVVLPERTNVRIIVTAADVLHNWTVPSFGVKIDACPGRLNEVNMLVKRPGVYYGQCSELCGVNHAFMPICVEVVSMEDYLSWVVGMLEDE